MAKPTNFVKACLAIDEAITRATRSGSGAHNRRAAMRRELALWASTAYASDTFDKLMPLRRLPWTRWDRELYRPSVLTACALRLMERDGFSRARALAFTGAAPGNLDYVLGLLKDVGLSVHDAVGQQSPDIELALATSLERMHVRLEHRALEDILLAAAEGYRVPASKRLRFTEVFGLCFGSMRRDAVSRDEHDVYVNVARVATQMRARATASEVTPNSGSLAAHLDVGDQFFPHLEVVGDYHTHPYHSFSDLVRHSGWRYSDMDERSLPNFVDEVQRRRSAPVFSLVVAVAEGGKSGKGPFRRKPNVVQLPIGNLFFVIGAYRILLDASYDDRVELNVPAPVM